MNRPHVQSVRSPQSRRTVALERPDAAAPRAGRAFAVARGAVLGAATTIAAMAAAGVLVGSNHRQDEGARRQAPPTAAPAALRPDLARPALLTLAARATGVAQDVPVPTSASTRTRRGRFATAQFADHDAQEQGRPLVRVAVTGGGEPAVGEAVDIVLTMRTNLQLGDAVRVHLSAADDRVSAAVAQRLGDSGLTDVIVVPGQGVASPSRAATLDLVRELCAREVTWHGLDAQAARDYCSITPMAKRRDDSALRAATVAMWDGLSWLDPGR